MKLHIITIVLDGMPTLPALFFNFNALNLDWTWHIMEGPAANVNDTKWCNPQDSRFSQDGSHEFIKMLFGHPRIRIVGRKMWEGGKVQMVNYPLVKPSDDVVVRHWEPINEPCLLLQCDADEIWRPGQLEKLVDIFERDDNAVNARFMCRYFLGVDIVSTTPGSYGNNPGEWLRAWRFTPGDNFISHEPPNLRQQAKGRTLTAEWTDSQGLVFDHYSWAFPNQVQYKEFFYNYPGAFDCWQRLQENKEWPVKLKSFLPWVDDRATAAKLA